MFPHIYPRNFSAFVFPVPFATGIIVLTIWHLSKVSAITTKHHLQEHSYNIAYLKHSP